MLINCYAEVSKNQFSNESTVTSSPTSGRSSSTRSSKWWNSTAKKWYGGLLSVAFGVIERCRGFKDLIAAYEYFKDYQPIKNVSSVSAKEHYLPRDEEMKEMEAKFSKMEENWRNANPRGKTTNTSVKTT